ncbi:hypothetical protein OEZ85_008432 [Tetradesmus obliquus]|uniref:4a-hydroxytetrahydrobiopterin dehydratase n=1 Tax=Tetradesmus obliquus TaxID=3088 RepID=A0ABY8TNH3_TETOB|nr:hypothetical protein OEZ85_008432 [Tetradesmus obliquus]
MALLLRYPNCASSLQNVRRGTRYSMAAVQHHISQQRRSTCCSATPLKQQRCEPCEEAKREAGYMGLHPMVMDMQTAEKYREQVDPRWQIVEDSEKRLRLRRVMRTKNFTKALELFQRVGQVAEAEGHHPDLHLEGWNNVSIELWTHARNGLSENDFIVAAKFDDIDLADLLSKKQPEV